MYSVYSVCLCLCLCVCVCTAPQSISELEASVQKLNESYQQQVAEFGENPKKMDSDEFYSIFNKFVRSFSVRCVSVCLCVCVSLPGACASPHHSRRPPFLRVRRVQSAVADNAKRKERADKAAAKAAKPVGLPSRKESVVEEGGSDNYVANAFSAVTEQLSRGGGAALARLRQPGSATRKPRGSMLPRGGPGRTPKGVPAGAFRLPG